VIGATAERQKRKLRSIVSNGVFFNFNTEKLSFRQRPTADTAFKGQRALAPAALAWMGIVFGDIGTSSSTPCPATREARRLACRDGPI
jgi:hypothetical protein